jgi:signal transduction histidine kinase
MPESALDEHQLRRLLRAGRSLVARLDLESVLDELLETARDLTGARYAALGVLDEERRELERFLTRGVDARAHRAIGDLPRGRGILGVLIDEPAPLRLHRVGDDPRSYGFPAGHPRMDTFLGVPVIIRGEAWGNLYLTEKAGGESFTDADQQAIVVLADWAAIAIDNARLYEGSEQRRTALERAVLGLEATTAIARAVGGETDLDRVLELIVKRGRALVDARALVIVLREGDGLAVAAGAGDVDLAEARGAGVAGDVLGDVMVAQEPAKITDPRERLGLGGAALGVTDPRSALLVPLVFRGRALGVLCAFDHHGAEPHFDDQHERLLLAFAASAATAVATAKHVAEDRVRHSLRSAEQERTRWARELHDDTLQAMAGLRLTLSAALRRGDPDALAEAVRDAVDELSTGIDGLRALIADLRPAALDQLGLAPALRALMQRVAVAHGLQVEGEIELASEDGGEAGRLEPDMETAVYRVVQEALTNVTKHSGAERVHVAVGETAGRVTVEVRDDGAGFDPGRPAEGFGLAGMRERMGLLGGELSVTSSAGGTVLRATAPARARRAAATR